MTLRNAARAALAALGLLGVACQDPPEPARQACALEEDEPDPQALERRGWAFVERARNDNDHAGYLRAEDCALAIEVLQPGSHAAALLRGYALHNLHRYRQAETLARRLVAERGLAYDWALLGDATMEQGDLLEAEVAYQRMIDLRPDANAYSRVAHFRSLVGDGRGAREMMHWAARAASPRAPDHFAWIWARLALYELQLGDANAALEIAERALEVAPSSSHALEARARILKEKT